MTLLAGVHRTDLAKAMLMAMVGALWCGATHRRS